ncbi:metal-dependent transcriptional regulator [Archaeoglobales archaeon]|nr:MAG: metal-dependent transcriptional regulator [Archaeoglobales archaeon]
MKESTYLRVIYKAYKKGLSVVGPSYVANKLGISKVTAYEALLKLAELDYGTYIPKKGFMLNNKGVRVGREVTRKHRLIECFLAELDMTSENACKEATRIECFVSDLLIKALEKKYGDREFCPCGYSLQVK